jgi:uncharacterized repeat protein (TIGR03943 family)
MANLGSNPINPPKSAISKPTRWRQLEWLDVLALGLWGVLLLKYWLSGRLGLLIHPHYFGLAIAAGFALLLVASLQAIRLWQQTPSPGLRHITLFPPGWMSGVLLIAAIVGLLITPRPFGGDTAIQRGLTDNFTVTRSRPQAFRTSQKSEDRSLIDWIRLLDVYPEPDAYQGQKAKVQGFVVHAPDLPENYLKLTRFVITCCAADAYPIGLPVRLQGNRQTFPADHWFEVTGEMRTETLEGKRQLVIQASGLKSIKEPANPFSY